MFWVWRCMDPGQNEIKKVQSEFDGTHGKNILLAPDLNNRGTAPLIMTEEKKTKGEELFTIFFSI